MAADKPLLLIDGSSYLFRAFHAMPDLQTRDGTHTGAIRGVIAMLRRLAKDYPGSPVAVVFDAKGKTFRNAMYEEYKANRPPMDDRLRQQIPPIHEMVEAMGMPLLVVPGVEADDVIGTLALQATKAKRHTVISTGDKDMAQLVTKYVSLVNTMTDTAMDEAGVVDKFGVRPDQIIDYLALMGDTADNIPGVPKVGPKTAAKWLGMYDTLDGLIAKADEIKGKVGESLRASLEQLPLSRSLTAIKCDVELEQSVEQLVVGEPNTDSLRELFERYEFKTWRDELDAADPAGAKASSGTGASSGKEALARNYECVLDKKSFDGWLKKLKKAPLIAFDTETTSLDYMDAELVGVSFSVTPGEAAYVPIAHDYEGAPKQLSLSELLAGLKPILEDPAVKKVGQNLKYDMSVLARYDVGLKGIAFDTMLESYVLNSVASRHNMDALAAKYLDIQTVHFEDIAGKGAKQLTFNQIPLEQAADYAAEDADITLRLHEELWGLLQKEPDLVSVFENIELPLVGVLSRIERNGTLLDAGLLGEQSSSLAKRAESLQEQVWTLAGEEFNMGSPKQLQKILFEKLDLPVIKKTPKGQPSTAEPVLQELAHDYEIPQLIMEYRSATKLKSTYTDKLPLQINQKTGRVHTSYHQAVAATGRLSSSDPNLQNIPIRTEDGRKVRQAFVAPPGSLLVAADYSQIELRIMAHLSKDKGLLTAFANGLDVHRATAAEVFEEELDGVTDDQRRSAKAINFGLIYGMSAFGLARQLGITRGVAQEYIDLYFDRYPGVRTYMDETRALAAEQGFVETVFGRRLYLPEINARNGMRRQAAERTAINAPMQGSAADIIKRAMIDVDAWLGSQSLQAKTIMQVHDELVFEVAEADVDALREGVVQAMQSAATLDVELIVDVGVGQNWDEAH